MEQEYKYMVATRCYTYNHAPYIEDALRGFAMQETTFPVVTIIVDDASTDGEPEVIQKYLTEHFQSPYRTEESEYANIICAKHKINVNCDFVVFLLKYNHYSIKKPKIFYLSEWLDNAKYHALCEGDDYWIEPMKLQMQVDFLENHPDYVLCHTDFDLSNGGRRNHSVVQMPDDNYFPDIIIKGQQIGTATTLFLNEAYQRTPKLYQRKEWPMGDFPMWIELSREGKIKFLPKATTCYRILDNSASHGSLEKELAFVKSAVEIRRFYAQYYRLDLPNDGYGKRYYTKIMKCACKHRSKETAAACLKEAVGKKMVSPKLLLFWTATYSRLFATLLNVIRR